MNNEVHGFIAEFENVLEQYSHLLYASRSKELQLEAIEELAEIQRRISTLKQQIVAERNDDLANALLSLEERSSSLAYELRMWVALKEGKAADAWDFLIRAQSAVQWAMVAHPIASNLQLEADRLDALEKVLFPPQLFMSAGMLIYECRCSICGEDYNECSHIKGQVYMGEICSRVITRAELLEGSIVKEPANKHCRAISITDENGVNRDTLTWEPVVTKRLYEDAEE